MAKKEHLEILKKGVGTWNKWRRDNPSVKPDLFNVNLKGANLADVNLSGVNLWEADLNKARLWRADLSGADISFANMGNADLRGASLRESNLVDADLSGAVLSFAYLRKANLWGADMSDSEIGFSDLKEANLSDTKLMRAKIDHSDFSSSDLSNSDFSDSVMSWCTFGDVDMSAIRGLKKVLHLGPSTIGVDTLFRSKGEISKQFLKGAGVPDALINGISALSRQPFQFSSCFISYAEDDSEFVERLYANFDEQGLRCWFAPEKDGKIINANIQLFDKLLLVLSVNSTESDWVEKAVTMGLDEEKKRKKTILFPMYTDDSALNSEKPWAAELRKNRVVLDFTGWKEKDAYRKSVGKLLDLLGHVHQGEIELPSGPRLVRQGVHDLPEIIYTVTTENECPLYDLGDRMKLSEISVLFPEEKPACCVLVEDILEVTQKYENLKTDAGYAFRCSGCSGSVRLTYKKESEEAKAAADDTAKMASLLGNFSIFKTLNAKDINYLASFLKMRNYTRGEIIIRKGDPGKNFYIVAEGKVEVVGDADLSIAFMGKGEIFGEMSLLSGKPVGATIRVDEDSLILYMSNAEFRNVLNKIPALQMYFTRLIAQRLNEMHDVRSKEFASGMVGKLSEMPPSELFQTLNANQKTGVISLELSKGKASLAFKEGGLIAAEYDNLDGKEAFFETLKEKDGRFKFIPGLTPEQEELDELGDFMWLLMDGMRKIDEGEE